MKASRNKECSTRQLSCQDREYQMLLRYMREWGFEVSMADAVQLRKNMTEVMEGQRQLTKEPRLDYTPTKWETLCRTLYQLYGIDVASYVTDIVRLNHKAFSRRMREIAHITNRERKSQERW